MTPERGTGGGSIVVLAALVASLAGCSGESTSAGDGGESGESSGGSSTGGMGGTSTGGNGGTGGSQRPSKLGLYLMLRNPSPDTRQCPASTGIEWDIGMPILSNGVVVDVDSPTPTDFGQTLEDGELDTEITCSVTAGGAFEATGGGIDPMINPPNGRINFAFAGTASPPREGTLEDISLYTPVTFQLTNSGGPSCSITAVHEVAPGALWADFDCPALMDAARPDVACHANGTIVIEYCATE